MQKNLSPELMLDKIREKYDITIGIEVHCQLASKSKMFSPSRNRYGDPANSNIDETCLALPGALPTINKECVALAVRMGLALNSQIQEVSVFARKNYFYPDLPKGYQITQFDKPLCFGGEIQLASGKKIGIERIQIEEDAGKNIHVGSASLVDYNRAGVGLIEIVSLPDITSPQEAVDYLKKLHSFAVNLEISDGNMERGNFRADANVSIKPKSSTKLGNRCEIKNVNSFKYIEKAIIYEVFRQYELLEAGQVVVTETRGYDSEQNVTVSQRLKESSKDYRYFPEPDLPPLVVTKDFIERVKKQMPELPESKQKRLVEVHGLPEYDAQVITASKINATYFENLVAAVHSVAPEVPAKQISNYFMTEILRAIKVISEKQGIAPEDLESIPISLEDSKELLVLQARGEISGRMAKDIFEEMLETQKSPSEIIKSKNLVQISDDSAIAKVCEQVIAESPKQLAEYLSGKDKLFGFFVGQTMKVSQGKLNPAKVNEILKELLEVKKRNQP